MYIVAALGQWPLVAGCFAGHAVGALLFGAFAMTSPRLIYEVRPRKDLRGVDLISDALPFGRLWYGRGERNQQRNRICQTSQPITSCRD